jgi:hypothetical protein
LLVDVLQGIKGIDGYLIDRDTHAFQRNQSMDFNGIHKDDGGKDEQESDEAASNNVYP